MSFFSSLTNINTGLQTVTAVVSQIESTAAAAKTAVTGAQKLQAAFLLLAAINPALAADAVALKSLVNASVAVFNLFGIFRHAVPAAPVAPVAPVAPNPT